MKNKRSHTVFKDLKILLYAYLFCIIGFQTTTADTIPTDIKISFIEKKKDIHPSEDILPKAEEISNEKFNFLKERLFRIIRVVLAYEQTFQLDKDLISELKNVAQVDKDNIPQAKIENQDDLTPFLTVLTKILKLESSFSFNDMQEIEEVLEKIAKHIQSLGKAKQSTPSPKAIAKKEKNDIILPSLDLPPLSENAQTQIEEISKQINTITNQILAILQDIITQWNKYTSHIKDESAKTSLLSNCTALRKDLQSAINTLDSITDPRETSQAANLVIYQGARAISYINYLLLSHFSPSSKFPSNNAKLSDLPGTISSAYQGLSILRKEFQKLSLRHEKYLIPWRTQVYAPVYKRFHEFTTKTFSGKLLRAVLNPPNLVRFGIFFPLIYYGIKAEMKEKTEINDTHKSNSKAPLPLWRNLYRTMQGVTAFLPTISATGFGSYNHAIQDREELQKLSSSVFPLCNNFVSASLSSILLQAVGSRIGSLFGLEDAYEKTTKWLHEYLMNELKDEEYEINEKFSDFDIHSPTFAYIEKAPLESIIGYTTKPLEYPGKRDQVPFTILVTGPSGCGKSTLVEAAAQTIANSGQKVMLRHFTPSDFANTNNLQTPDLFQQIKGYIRYASQGEIVIAILDEFHLFFYKDGKFCPDRLEGFLTALTDINTRQKGKVGGFFLVACSNRPALIPHELLANPDRIRSHIRIDYPAHEERVHLMQKQLEIFGLTDEGLELENISKILEGNDVSQGKVLEIIKNAITLAHKEKRRLNTSHLYEAVNNRIRYIHKDLRGASNRVQEATAFYYAAASLVCESIDKYLHLDSTTIYANVPYPDPKPFESLYEKPERQKVYYGNIYTWREDKTVSLLHEEQIYLECLTLLSGSVYAKTYNMPLIPQATDDRKKAKELAYKLYSYGLDDDILTKEQSCEAHHQASLLLEKAEKNLTLLFSSKEFKNDVQSIAQALLKNKFITYHDLRKIIAKESLETYRSSLYLTFK